MAIFPPLSKGEELKEDEEECVKYSEGLSFGEETAANQATSRYPLTGTIAKRADGPHVWKATFGSNGVVELEERAETGQTPRNTRYPRCVR